MAYGSDRFMRKIRFKKKANKYVSSKRRRWLNLKNHPLMVPAVTLFILLAITGASFLLWGGQTVSPSDSHIVILTDNHKKQTVPTRASTVGDLLRRMNVKIDRGDVVEPAAKTKIMEDNFRVNIYRALPNTIVDGGRKTFVLSAATTARSIASAAGVKVYAEDYMQIKVPESIILSGGIGREIVITRATPAFLNLYGTPVAVRTHADTVAALLQEKHITLAKGDTVQPRLTTLIKKNILVFVLRKGTKMVTVSEEVPMPTQYVDDASLSYGTTVVRQQGSSGKRLSTYFVTKKGAKTTRKKIQSIIVQEAVPQIVARGVAVDIPGDKNSVLVGAGVPVGERASAYFIIAHESNWRPDARSSSGCIGLGQNCPSGGQYWLVAACPQWQFDAVCQVRRFSQYAQERYGGWNGAYSYWQGHGSW